MNNQTIIDIIKRHRGEVTAINQHNIADIYMSQTGKHITPREVRRIIESLRFSGEPILSSPNEPGGYYYPMNMREFHRWEVREMAKAKKQIAKIEPVRVGVLKMFRKPVIQQAWDFGKKMLRVS